MFYGYDAFRPKRPPAGPHCAEWVSGPVTISTFPMEMRLEALRVANAALTNPTPDLLVAYARELLPWIAKGDAPDETP